MFSTFLFDLDGTLVPMDTERFTRAYMAKVACRFAAMADPDFLIKSIWAGTMKMVADTDPRKTNREVFWSHFQPLINIPTAVLEPEFERFYADEFPALEAETRPNPLAETMLDNLFSKGYTVAIATNPLFPELAIRERMRWVGIDHFPFALVTTYEQMHFCKPRVEYYSEVLERLGAEPQDCLMVGNDVEEDLVAGKLGIKTYLVEDCLLNQKNLPLEADYHGSFADLAAFLQQVTERPGSGSGSH